MTGEVDLECGSAEGATTMNVNASLHLTDEFSHEKEPQPGPMCRPLKLRATANEPLEDLAPLFKRNARPIVRNADDHPA